MFADKLKALKAESLPGRLEPNEARVQALETHLEIALPADYRQFVLEHAGVSVQATCPLREPSPCGADAAIEQFYGFMEQDRQQLDLQHASDMAGGAPIAMPIAEGPFASQIFLFLESDLSGMVCFYDAEQRYFWPDYRFRETFSALHPSIEEFLRFRSRGGLPEKPPGMENFYRLADSFGDFLAACECWDWRG